MSRGRVFLYRLAASGALLLLAFGMVRLLWYPGAYFVIAGVGRQLLILVAVAIIAGPALSAFVYRPGKKSLAMDLSILAAIEVTAVVAALVILYQRQPHFSVFTVDRFEAVAIAEVDAARLGNGELTRRPGHAPRLVYARMPEDPEALNRLVEETVFEGMADIDRRPEFWRPYHEGIAAVRAAAQPLAQLLAAGDDRSANVERWLVSGDFTPAEIGYLPLRGRAADATLLLHLETGFPVATLAVDPWPQP